MYLFLVTNETFALYTASFRLQEFL